MPKTWLVVFVLLLAGCVSQDGIPTTREPVPETPASIPTEGIRALPTQTTEREATSDVTAAPTAQPTHTGTSSPTPQQTLLFLPECDPSADGAVVPTPDETDTIPGWVRYANPTNGFSFRYPPDWTIVEGPHYLCLNHPSALEARLVVGFKRAGENLTIQRSGVGAGDIVKVGSVTFLGQEVSREVVVFQGKDKAVLYNNGTEIHVGDLVFTLNLDDFRMDYEAVDLPEDVQDVVDEIVESFTLE